MPAHALRITTHMDASIPINFNFWFLQTIAMLLTALALPNLQISNPISAFIAVAGLALVNATVWDAALFFSIPDSLTYQTVILMFVNGIIFWIIAKFLPGIATQGFLASFLAPMVFTVISILLYHYARHIDFLEIFKSAAQHLTDMKDYFLSQQSAPPLVATPLPR